MLAETLGIFGLNANYLKHFLDMLKTEGIEAPINRVLPLKIDEDLLDAGLTGIELRDDYSFLQETRAFSIGELNDVSVSVGAAIEVGTMAGTASAATKDRERRLEDTARALLPFEDLYQHALDYKARKGWHNLYISREGLDGFIKDRFKLAAPHEVLTPKTLTHYNRLVAAVKSGIEDGLSKFYLTEQRHAESKELRLVTVSKEHTNFPRVKNEPAYTLKIPTNMLEQVEALIADTQKMFEEDKAEPLPRLYVTQHLYNPLLIKSAKGSSGVKSTPTGLEDSEVNFIDDLRAYWQRVSKQDDWQDYSVYLMRNLPKKGIGFFQTAGFYPDFLLWLKQEDTQALAFIDPKGLVQWDEEKVQLLKVMPDLGAELGLAVEGFITTDTNLDKIQVQGLPRSEKRDYLEGRHIFLQENPPLYIEKIIAILKGRLEAVVA
jgi:hypothetical protein